MNDSQLTKKEEYLLKKEKKEKEKLGFRRQRLIKKIAMIFLPLVLISGGLVLSLKYYFPEEKEISGTPKIEINPLEYDAGTVSMAEGLVKYTYEIQNKGDGDLKIDRIWTSCDCTAAILKVGDKISPKFGMHQNPAFWSQKIATGETGYLEVIFDPAFHGPGGTGLAVRAVYLSSNDPQNQKAEVRLSANVIP